MTFTSGDCFYSKKLGKNVMYATGGRFVSVGYRLEMFTREELGELDALVRNVHYQAALDTAESFIDAVAEEKKSFYYQLDTTWRHAIDSISERVQRGRTKATDSSL